MPCVDVELHGETIGAGQNVLLLYPSANRDETVFDDPETFDIRRQPNDHVAFGFGAHLCLGHRLARAEIVGMVDRILDRLPDIHLADDDTAPAAGVELHRRLRDAPGGVHTQRPGGGVAVSGAGRLGRGLLGDLIGEALGHLGVLGHHLQHHLAGGSDARPSAPPPGPRSSWPACWRPIPRWSAARLMRCWASATSALCRGMGERAGGVAPSTRRSRRCATCAPACP